MSNINILRDIDITSNSEEPSLENSVSVSLVDYIGAYSRSGSVEVHGYLEGQWTLLGTVTTQRSILDLRSYDNIYLKSDALSIIRIIPIKSRERRQEVSERLKFGKGLSELSSIEDKDTKVGTILKKNAAEEYLSEGVGLTEQVLSVKPNISQVTSEYLYNNIYVINILGENFTKDTEVYIYENTHTEEDISSLNIGYLNNLESASGKLKDLVEIGLFESKLSTTDFLAQNTIPFEGLILPLEGQTFTDVNHSAIISSEVLKVAIEGVTGDKTYSVFIKNEEGSYLYKDCINIVLTGDEPQIDDPLGDDDGDGIPNYLDLFPRFYGDVPEGLDIGPDAFGSLDLWFNMSSLPDIDVPLHYPYYKIDYDYPELKAYYMDDDNVVHDVTEYIQILDTRSVVTGISTTNTVRYFISNDRVPEGIQLNRSVVVDRYGEGEVSEPEYQVGLRFNIDPLPSITVQAGTDLSGFDYSIEGLVALYGVGGIWITVSSEENPISISVPPIDTTEGGDYDIEYSFTYEETDIKAIRKLTVDGLTEIKWKISGIEIESLEPINFSDPVDYDILDFSEPQLSATYLRYDSEGVLQEEVDLTSSITEDSSSIPQPGIIPFGSYPYKFRTEYGVTKSYIPKFLKIMEIEPDETELGQIVWTPQPSSINLNIGDAVPDLSYATLSVKYVSPAGQEYPLDHTKNIPSVSTVSVATFAAVFTPVDTNGVIPFAERVILQDLTITISVSSPNININADPDNSYIEFEPSVLPAVVTQDNVNFDIATDFNNFEYPSLKAYYYDNDGVQTEITGSIEVIIPNKLESSYNYPYTHAFNQDGTIRNDYPAFHSILYKAEHQGKIKILKRTFEIEDTVAPVFNKEPSEFVEKGTKFGIWSYQFNGQSFFGQDYPRVTTSYNPARTGARWYLNITGNQFENLDVGDAFTFFAETQDSYGNKTTMEKVITCRDTVAPTISFSSTLTFEPGAAPTEQDMRIGFNVSDESNIASTSVIYSSVDFNTEGVYQALYTAEDIHGNSKTQRRTVIVASPATVEGPDCLPTENIPPVQITTKTILSEMTDQDWIYPLKAAEGTTDITLSINVDYSTVNAIPIDGQGRVEYTVDGSPAVGSLPYQIRYTVQDLDNPDYEICTVRPITLLDAHEPYFTNSPTEININLNTGQVSDFDLMLSQIKEQLLSEDLITDYANLEYSTKEGLYSAEAVDGNSVQKTIIVTDAAGNSAEYGPVTINFSVTQLLKGFWEENVSSISFDSIESTLDNTAKYYGYGTFRDPNFLTQIRTFDSGVKSTLSLWYQKTSNENVSDRSKLVVAEIGDFRVEEDPKNSKYRVYDFAGNVAVEGTSDWSSGNLRHIAVSNAPNGAFRVYSQGQKVSENYRPEDVGTFKSYAGGPKVPIATPTEMKNFLEYIPYLDPAKGSYVNGFIEGSNPVRIHGQDPGTVSASNIQIASDGIVSDEITFNFWVSFDKQTLNRKYESLTYLECGNLRITYGSTHFTGTTATFRSPDGILRTNLSWATNTTANPLMFTVTYSPSDGCKFYLNSNLKVETAPTGSQPTWSDFITFFKVSPFTNSGTHHAGEWMGSLQVENRVMNTTEIINLYNQGNAYEITPRAEPVIYEDYPAGAYGYVDSVESVGSILSDNQIEELYYLGQDVLFSELAAKSVDQNEIETFINNNVLPQQFYLDGTLPDSPDGNFIEFANYLTISGGKLLFSSENGYATLSNSLDASGDFTISCWCAFTGRNQTLFYDSVNNISFLHRGYDNYNGHRTRVISSDVNENYSNLPTSGFGHLVLMGKNGRIYLYVNGQSYGSVTQPAGGQITDIRGLMSELDEVRYWNVSITEEQISILYSNSQYY